MRQNWKSAIIFREMRSLEDRIAVVTGGTEGVGRGIAAELSANGARVFVTGRSIHEGALDGSNLIGIRCDHREDQQVAAAFEQVAKEGGAIGILVNNVWGGYEQMIENGGSPGTSRFENSQSGAGMRCSLLVYVPTMLQAN
jgi:NAD(P)-dependent dehydrogenase (short-subunit alcohol dehydrogenase family)